MRKFNPEIIDDCCVRGDTKLMTVNGVKTFKELAESNEDVEVYCLDCDGNLKVSKMFHPRVSGYNIELMKIVLSNGFEINVTTNHMILTKTGYVMAGDLYEGDEVVTIKNNVDLPKEIDEKDRRFTEYTGTKKGTVIKKCEISGEEFECVWDEREVCSKDGYEADLYNIKNNINTVSDIYEYVTVKSVEFPGIRENVYNGTVAVYHNYFTIDEKIGTIINQYN